MVSAERDVPQPLLFLRVAFFVLNGGGSISGQSQDEIVLGALVVLRPSDTQGVHDSSRSLSLSPHCVPGFVSIRASSQSAYEVGAVLRHR